MTLTTDQNTAQWPVCSSLRGTLHCAPQVTLVIPWVAQSDQGIIFPNDIKFEQPAQQEEWVRNWVNARTSFPCNFKIAFYPGRYAHEKFSILPVGDPTEYIPDAEVSLPLDLLACV